MPLPAIGPASNQLRQLRDLGLLELRGRGSATHYVLGANARVEKSGELAEGQTGELPLLGRQTGELGGQSGNLPEQKGELGGQSGNLPEQKGESLVQPGGLPMDAPDDLRSAIQSLGGKPTPRELRRVIIELCLLRWWTPKELAVVLGRRSPAQLAEKHLSVLVNEGRLQRRFPQRPHHPEQAYRTRRAAESPEETE